MLEQEGEAVGAAGGSAHVHIDSRDSCEMPRAGGERGGGGGGGAWSAQIDGPSGARVEVVRVSDLGDGTHRVEFQPREAGRHSLAASLSPGGEGFTAAFEVAVAPGG